MKFSCYKEDLADALKVVMPAVAVKPQMPVLSGVYLKADNNVLEIHANNITNGTIVRIPINTEEPGEIVVAGKKFQECAANMPDRTVSCYTENNSFAVQSGSATVRLLTMTTQDFPKVKSPDAENSFKIRTNVLQNLIRRTSFAASREEGIRPIFSGCNFEIRKNLINVVATNTHRLAFAKTSIEYDSDPFAFIVPASTLNALLNRLDPKDADNFVTVCSTNRAVAFQFDNVFTTARLIEGIFPSTDKIIPTNSTTSVQVNAADLKKAIDIVALMAKETEYNTIKLSIHNNMIEIFANSNEIGSAEQIIEATVEGEELGIAFNYNYLTDVLKVVDAPDINIAFNGQFSPALVTVPGDDNFKYVVTPVRA